jgi:hypothetical protein
VTVVRPCIGNPTSYANSGFCPLSCVNGNPVIGPRQASQPAGPSAHCSNTIIADSVCEVSCAGPTPVVRVLPEPMIPEQLLVGVVLLLLLAKR